MFSLSRITNYRRKRKKKIPKKNKGISRMQRHAKKLEDNLSASEKWFREMWLKDMPQDSIPIYQDCFNKPFGKHIPDVINFGYHYIIEIDGGYHNDPIQQWKDVRRDDYYKNKDFETFRIVAFDLESYSKALAAIREHIKVRGRRY